MPAFLPLRKLISPAAVFPVDFRRMFLYKETPDRGHQAHRTVPQRLKTNETDAQQPGIWMVAESLDAKPLTVLCAMMGGSTQTETGGFKQTRFPFLFCRPAALI